MLTIEEQPSRHAVIVTVDASPAVMDDLEGHARSGLAWFAEFAGFVSGALHRSADGSRLVQYLQWSDEASYLRCRDDARWDEMASAQLFMAHVEAGRATVDERSYEVLRIVTNDDL